MNLSSLVGMKGIEKKFRDGHSYHTDCGLRLFCVPRPPPKKSASSTNFSTIMCGNDAAPEKLELAIYIRIKTLEPGAGDHLAHAACPSNWGNGSRKNHGTSITKNFYTELVRR